LAQRTRGCVPRSWPHGPHRPHPFAKSSDRVLAAYPWQQNSNVEQGSDNHYVVYNNCLFPYSKEVNVCSVLEMFIVPYCPVLWDESPSPSGPSLAPLCPPWLVRRHPHDEDDNHNAAWQAAKKRAVQDRREDQDRRSRIVRILRRVGLIASVPIAVPPRVQRFWWMLTSYHVAEEYATTKMCDRSPWYDVAIVARASARRREDAAPKVQRYRRVPAQPPVGPAYHRLRADRRRSPTAQGAVARRYLPVRRLRGVGKERQRQKFGIL